MRLSDMSDSAEIFPQSIEHESLLCTWHNVLYNDTIYFAYALLSTIYTLFTTLFANLLLFKLCQPLHRQYPYLYSTRVIQCFIYHIDFQLIMNKMY